MALSKESIKKLRAVKAAILAEPELYDQGFFAASRNPNVACATACCIAGWALWLENPTEFRNAAKQKSDFNWVGRFAEILGVEYWDVDPLTDPGGCWLQPYGKRYGEAETDKERADVAAARIDHFIATGE